MLYYNERVERARVHCTNSLINSRPSKRGGVHKYTYMSRWLRAHEQVIYKRIFTAQFDIWTLRNQKYNATPPNLLILAGIMEQEMSVKLFDFCCDVALLDTTYVQRVGKSAFLRRWSRMFRDSYRETNYWVSQEPIIALAPKNS